MSYLDERIADVYAENGLDEGADDEVTDRDVGQDDVVGRAGKVGEIPEGDTEEDVDDCTDQRVEELGKYQDCRPSRLHCSVVTEIYSEEILNNLSFRFYRMEVTNI